MATVHKDAKLLTQESDMITKINGNEDYDVDLYVERLSKITKKKLKIYRGAEHPHLAQQPQLIEL